MPNTFVNWDYSDRLDDLPNTSLSPLATRGRAPGRVREVWHATKVKNRELILYYSEKIADRERGGIARHRLPVTLLLNLANVFEKRTSKMSL
jgi:hypothetical protein